MGAGEGSAAAPAVSALGLPKAVTQGGGEAKPAAGAVDSWFIGRAPEDLRTLNEAVAELRSRGATPSSSSSSSHEGCANHEELRPLVDRSLELAAAGAPLAELAGLAEAFVELRLRFPLRDMMAAMSERLQAPGVGDEVLPDVIRLLGACGRGNLFPGDLLDFCGDRVQSMTARDLSTFVYEAGRHGLRSRQHCAAALSRAVELVPEMAPGELLRAWQGFIQQSRNWMDFYVAALPCVQQRLDQLTTQQLILVLRVARDLRFHRDFVDLHAAVSRALMGRSDDLTLGQVASSLMYSGQHRDYRAQTQGLVLKLQAKLMQTQDLSGLRVVEIVDILETLASWNLRPLQLADRLDALLVERKVELQYTGNLSLWVRAVKALARMDHLDAKWPEAAMELSRDLSFVQRITFWQQCDLISALGKLRRFDQAAFDNIAEAMLPEVGLWKELREMSMVVWAFAQAGCFHEGLFNRSYDLLLEWMENEKIDLSKATEQSSMSQAAWAFTVAGFHQREESFAAVLDYVLFPDMATHRAKHLRSLAQLVDTIAMEAPACVQNCQYPERVQEVLTHHRVRELLAKDTVGDLALLQEVRMALSKLGWRHDVAHMPDGTCAFPVDVSFEPQVGRKAGLLVCGKHDVMVEGISQEGLRLRDSGELALAKRVLSARGWRVVSVERGTWSSLQTDDARRDFLEQAVSA